MSKVTIRGLLLSTQFEDLLNVGDVLGDDGVQIRVNPEKTAVEYFTEEDDSGGNPQSFTTLKILDNMGASQGVASDGKFLYTTGYPEGYADGHDYIMKYTKDGTLVATNPTATTDGTLQGTQVNSIFIKDGLLYISCNNYASPQTPSADSAIKVFKSSDLTYVTEYQVKNNICEGYAFKDGYWWGVYNDLMVVSQRNLDWTHLADHTLTYTVDGSFKYQGIVWIDDYILVNIHDGTSTTKYIDVYKWNGTSFDEVRRIDQIVPDKTGQGIYKEPNKNILWWAGRHDPTTGVHRVYKTRINYLISATND